MARISATISASDGFCLRRGVEGGARQSHQRAPPFDGEAAGPVIADVGALLGDRCVFLSPLLKLDLQRLAADQPLERGDPRLVFGQQLGRRHVLVERTGLRLLDPDPDQVARQVMASAERVKRLPGVVLGNDLTLEVDAVAAVSGHGPSSSESPAPVNREPPHLSNPMVPRFRGHGFRPFVVRPVPGSCIRERSGSAAGYSSPRYTRTGLVVPPRALPIAAGGRVRP